MAKQKETSVNKSSKTVYGSDSTDVIDVMKIYGNSNTVYAQKGNDQITLFSGKNHKLYGGAGKDTITVTKSTGTGNRIYGQDGNDIINVNGGSNNRFYGGNGADTIKIAATAGTGNRIYGENGNDIINVNGGRGNYIYGGNGGDTITLSKSAGNGNTVNGNAGTDTIKVYGGSGHIVNGGIGNDNIYIYGGSVKSVDNAGGSDYIQIGKNAGNGIKVESGAASGYKLAAAETVKVLGGNSHDIRLYGGNDKVIIAGGKNHVVYTDGPTGSGDAGGDDIIVIQSGGVAKKIVAGNGSDVIAVANGAGNGSTIYTGLEDPNGKNSGTGSNTVNLLGGSGHTVYLGGTKNQVLVEAQNVTLNKYAGTSDDIRIRWSEQGTGTLRINCPSVSSSKTSTLRLEGVNSWNFEFYKDSVAIKNANGAVSEYVDALVMKFVGNYVRDPRTVSGTYQWEGDNSGNTNLPVYINTNGRVQYNWCAGNQQISYNSTPVATGGSIEITRWNVDSLRVFDAITFDNGTYGYEAIKAAINRENHMLGNG